MLILIYDGAYVLVVRVEINTGGGGMMSVCLDPTGLGMAISCRGLLHEVPTYLTRPATLAGAPKKIICRH